VGGEDVHPDSAEARRGDHRRARVVVGGFGGERRDRPRARLGARHASGDWVSMGVPSDGSYGIPEGLIFGYPCTTSGGKYQVVKGLSHNDFAKAKIAATQKELTEERAAIEQLLK
jgi:hypothetical protein